MAGPAAGGAATVRRDRNTQPRNSTKRSSVASRVGEHEHARARRACAAPGAARCSSEERAAGQRQPEGEDDQALELRPRGAAACRGCRR